MRLVLSASAVIGEETVLTCVVDCSISPIDIESFDSYRTIVSSSSSKHTENHPR